MRILIVKLGAIGDVLRTTSILSGLKEKYPGAEIDWLISRRGKEILTKNPLLDRIIVWEERGQLGNYDLAIGLEDELAAAEIVSQTGKTILGAYADQDKVVYTPSAWFDMSTISKFGLTKANLLKQNNQKTFQQHMADLLGIGVGHYVFNLNPDEVEYGKKVKRELGIEKREKVMGINTGAGRRWEFKALSVEKTIDLINRIKNDLGLASIILGGEDEKERNQIISQQTGMPNAGTHTLRQFSAIINQCAGVISSDSLAMHFAIALKKPVVVFFGPTSAAEIELYGLGVKVQPKIDCLVCYKKKCDRKPSCVDEMGVDDLFQAAKSLL